MKIQFIVIGTQKRNTETPKSTQKNDNHKTIETNNQMEIYLQEQE
jgi:hypothetical protein